MTFSQKEQETKREALWKAVDQQVEEELEIGDEPLTRKQEITRKMVLQKFGIIPPQFTASEKNLILREQRTRSHE